jgi:redox-sensitive bicupin YhaK (pirin superfamily)
MLAAAKPIGEPIVQGGPFVMTTEGEVRQAMLDYQQGRF